MVVQTCNVIRTTVFITCAVLATVTAALADVTAKTDRTSVDLNESFVLELIVDTNIDIDPDLTVLDENFHRGQVSQLSNTSIINGQISRTRTWNIVLMAKAIGFQEIPSISIGNDKSAPLSIDINEPSTAPPGEADVFVTSEIDQSQAFVQSQILYRFKIYRAVATRQEGRRDPGVSGVEVLLEEAGEDRNYEAILSGRAYNVIERVLAIYPQASGEVTISPSRFEARVFRDGRITGRKVFESQSHTVTVLPIPAPPAEFPDAQWLPARDVQLSEEWSREPDKIAAGEPLTRKVTISALGQIETQIPALEPPTIAGMNIYADKPDLTRRSEAEGIRGIRRDQYAMIGVRSGPVEVPKLDLPWWDIAAGEWRVASLAARTIDVKAATVDTATLPPAAADLAGETSEETAFEAGENSGSDPFWKRVSQLIAGVWLLTVLAWWWSSREGKREPREPEPPPIYKQQSKFVKAASKAASAGDRAAVRAALLDWGRLQWPDDAPRSVGEVAARVAAPLSDELAALSASSYSDSADIEWDGSALATALRSIHALTDDTAETIDAGLPPLMPPNI